jgi:uncharacterized protein
LTTEYVLWEMVNAFSSVLDRPQAHALMETVQTSVDWEVVSASKELLDIGVHLHRLHNDKSWSLTDCISFHVMRQKNIAQSLAHDHFEQAGFEALLRRDPP